MEKACVAGGEKRVGTYVFRSLFCSLGNVHLHPDHEQYGCCHHNDEAGQLHAEDNDESCAHRENGQSGRLRRRVRMGFLAALEMSIASSTWGPVTRCSAMSPAETVADWTRPPIWAAMMLKLPRSETGELQRQDPVSCMFSFLQIMSNGCAQTMGLPG